MSDHCQGTEDCSIAQITEYLNGLTPEFLPALPAPGSGRSYQRAVLSRDEHKEVIAAHWVAGGESVLHSHEQSAAVYRVLSGSIEEERYIPEGDGYRYELVTLRAGEETSLPPGAFHRVRALEEAVTLHAYFPPPANASAPVSEPTRRLLDMARRHTQEKHDIVSLPPRRTARPDVAALTRELAEQWGEAERQSNQEGELRLPPATLEQMRACGILGAPMPGRWGGWGLSLRQTVEVVRQIAQKAPSTALALAMPLGNAATTRIPEAVVPRDLRLALRDGQRWIAERILAGRILAVANSEPGAGGELKNTRTVAQLGEDGTYYLTGRKSFATFGRDADFFLCAARRSDRGRAGVVDGFFVERGAAGLTIDDRWDPAGMRPTASVGLTLEGAPAETILGYPGCLEGVNARHWSTVLFAAVFLGIGERLLQEGVALTGESAIWARSTLAECTLNLSAAQAFIESVARDDRWPLPDDLQERARRAKTFIARTTVETAMQVAMISGGRSYTPNHPIFRFLCDALAGPLLRPPLPQAMDSLVNQLFPPSGRVVGKSA
jgi:alkylation response protein AidB-like acyl-CoA dehydrogenase/mannose-6-phosphate isomerase-like protein (cupin superfamily)